MDHKDLVLLLNSLTEISQRIWQSLQSQQLLLLALSEQAADAPRLHERYQELLREHEHAAGEKLPRLPVGP